MWLHAVGCLRNVARGKGGQLALNEVFPGAGAAAGQLFGNHKGACGDAQARVMAKAAPTSALVAPHTQLLLQFQRVALDAPAHVHSDCQIVVVLGTGLEAAAASPVPVNLESSTRRCGQDPRTTQNLPNSKQQIGRRFRSDRLAGPETPTVFAAMHRHGRDCGGAGKSWP